MNEVVSTRLTPAPIANTGTDCRVNSRHAAGKKQRVYVPSDPLTGQRHCGGSSALSRVGFGASSSRVPHPFLSGQPHQLSYYECSATRSTTHAWVMWIAALPHECECELEDSPMISLQQRIAALRSLVAQLHELDRLRERVRKAEMSVRRSRRIGPKKRTLH